MNSIENNIAENLLIKNSVTHKTSTMLHRQKSLQYQNIKYDDVNSVRGFAFESCKEYLGGVWKKIRNSQFQIEKISGGLSNYLYLCSVPDNCEPIGTEPTKVLIRIYGENHHNNSSIVLKDVVLSAIMSDKDMGPKLYGVLPIGRIEEYIPSTDLQPTDLYDPLTSEKIAKTLAKFHALEMPFVKEPRWLFDTTSRYLKQIGTSVNFSNPEDIQKFNKLIGYDLPNEFLTLMQLLENVKSPVVFCHNDLQPGNILKMNDDSLVVIDYEYGSYNYRGFDIGNHFCEWMMVNVHNTFPFFICNPHLYPNREQQLNFIRSYIKEYIEINKQTEIDYSLLNEEKILIEANYYSLASNFFWSIWAICQASATKIQFSYLDYALARMELYLRQKQKILEGEMPPTF